ncbi:MAG: hypothetical protein KJZ93_23725 [Caldilineaceae bacterium]|nr:hypothetical protein [Caldilineaceae bacterium]
MAGLGPLGGGGGRPPPPPTPPTPTVTLAPASEPVAAPTVPEPAPTATPVESGAVDYTQVAAVEGDFYTLGNPDAPVLLIDFSDFL